MNELNLKTPKPKLKATKTKQPKNIKIISPCGNGNMTFLENDPMLTDLISKGWKRGK